MPAASKNVRYWKVKDGAAPHTKGGKSYTPGMIMESRTDMAKHYPNKFVEVAGPNSNVAPAPVKEQQDAAPTLPNNDAPKGGQEGVQEQGVQTPNTPDPSKVPGELGEDVTAQFPMAEPAGVLVFKKGAWHHIADSDSPNTPMNEKALNKAGVEEYLKTLINS